MIFERLIVVDAIDITDSAADELSSASKAPVPIPKDDPSTTESVLERCSGADAIVTSWRTPITADVIAASPQLRYVGLCASPFADPKSCNIDLEAAARRDVTVSALGQYGDEATAEWVIATMLNAAHHIGPVRWRSRRTELYGKTLGVVGLGAVGTEVAARAHALGMKIAFSSRNDKPEARRLGYARLSLIELLRTSDIVSVHIGKGVEIMGSAEFEALEPQTLLINTSLGPVFDSEAFGDWLSRGGLAVGDVSIDPTLAGLMHQAPGAHVSDQLAADTVEMKQRKSDQLVENVQSFLRGTPTRTV